MKNALEQVFWKKGKFVNSKNKEVEARQIGESHVVNLSYPFIEEEIMKKTNQIILNKNYSQKINAYMICGGIEACYSFITEPGLIYVTLNFYKI